MQLEYQTHNELMKNFSWDEAWEYVDGTPEDVNAAHECLTRHHRSKTAFSVSAEDGSTNQFTFGELSDSAAQFANHLAGIGGHEESIAIMLEPSFEFVTSFFGAMQAGAVPIPCSELFGPDALQYRIDTAEPAVLITSATIVEELDTSQVGQVIHQDEFRNTISEYDTTYDSSTSQSDDAWIQFTSGTTGKPTPVPYQHGDIVRFAPVMDMTMDFGNDDICLTTSSTGWGTGIWIGLFAPLILGLQTAYYSGRFEPTRILNAIEEFDVNVLLGVVPTAYRKLVDANVAEHPTIDKANYVGEPMDSDLSKEITQTFGAFPRSTYGATEIRSIITMDYGFPDYEFRHGSMGKPLPKQEVAILDEDGNVLQPGKVGNIAVRRKDDWIRTGDAGFVDEDGYFWSAGRADDTIISAGYTIGPQEVEDSVRSHPGVAEVGVIGVPDEERGEIVKAFIKPEGTISEDFVDELQSYVRNQLSKHEYPREIELIDEIPTTPDGKIKRADLREYEGIS